MGLWDAMTMVTANRFGEADREELGSVDQGCVGDLSAGIDHLHL